MSPLANAILTIVMVLVSSVVSGVSIGHALTVRAKSKAAKYRDEMQEQVEAYRVSAPGHEVDVTYENKTLTVKLSRILQGRRYTVATYQHGQLSWGQARTMMAVHRTGLQTSFDTAFVNLGERVKVLAAAGGSLNLRITRPA